MIEFDVTIVNRLGLHARAAAKFVHLAGAIGSRVTVAREGTRVDGKSILGLLTLAASKGTKLRLSIQGDDEVEAGSQLSDLVRSRFGEEA